MLAASLIAGCASYAPHPLATGAVAADSAVLRQDAATIDRPFLKPVTIDLAAPLDDNAVAVLAVLGNPDLRALRLKAGVTDAQAFSARLLPDPTFSVGTGRLLKGPDPVSEITSMLGFELNSLRTRAVRRQQATAAARQVRLDLAWAEWQTAGQARLQAARIRRLAVQVDLVRFGVANANSLLQRTTRAAGRGDVAASALQAARADSVVSTDKLVTTERDLQVARFELTKLLGLPPETPLSLAPMPAGDTPLDSARLVQIAEASRTDLQALRAGYDVQEAVLRKAVLDQFPTLALALNFTRDTSENYVFGPAVDFTLPLWNRNRGGIAIERATREQLRAEYDGRLFQSRADIAAAVGAVTLARSQRDLIRRALPQIEKFAVASRRAANRGDLPIATAEAAEGTLGDRRAALAAAEQTIDEAMVVLELLTGVPKEDWK